ncbi:MAG: DUF3516 domain-containing protein [Acidobacteriota bacterium]
MIDRPSSASSPAESAAAATSDSTHHDTDATEANQVPSLAARIPAGGTRDADEILDLFLGWVADIGFELYPAQEEALLEIMAGRHVVLNTPTGSGKSLVALGMHFKALCEGKRCFYTSPIKALASEKFFSLCDDLGAENVGMQTGDASINADASVICATAEVLANRALRQGSDCGADYVVMDEFHYYGDRDRGVAWQVPLITLPGTTFLLMSATLGNTAPITERLERFSGRKVSSIYSMDRPVPLDYEYRETPLHETVATLLEDRKAPIYVVNFTQRECAELAQSLTSIKLCTRAERDAIKEAIGSFRYDTPYGKEIRRFLSFGVGVHHAGLLPKYRLLVEQLAQQGLLKVICGTDTLGVGVNIPIRTVLFTKLSKYDGKKVSILKVRDFQQISGRAGRKGYDDRGSVVCQAPEHVIEVKRMLRDPKKRKKASKKKPPPGFVEWDRKTFDSLIQRPPETLKSRFRVTHGMLVDLIQRDAELDLPDRDNFDSLRELIDRSHEPDNRKAALLSYAAILVRSLHRADVIQMQKDGQTDYRWVVVNHDLQWDFSLFQALALYLVEAIDVLEPDDPEYAVDLTTVVEAVLEDPRVVLYRQLDKVKGDEIARMKAEGIHYEERMAKLEELTHPKPALEFIEATFEAFRQAHPWVRGEDIHPKSIGREMFEGYYSFNQYVRTYGLQRSEGVLLRYMSQLYKTMVQTVPERAKTEAVYDVIGYFRTLLQHTDTSLIEEWESMAHPELQLDQEAQEAARREMAAYELFHDPKAFRARVRAELHQLVRALAEGEWDEAAASIWPAPDDSEFHWTADALQEAIAPYLAEYEQLVFNHEARRARNTRLTSTGPRSWEFTQVLVDPEEHNLWYLGGVIDLSSPEAFQEPLLRLRHLGT